MEFEYCVFIGRLAPIHNGHLALIRAGLNKAEKLIIVLGSVNKAIDTKNPWTVSEREEMVLAALTEEERSRISFIRLKDYFYNENLWLAELNSKVSEATNDSESVALIGCDHDTSSYYLYLFPQWTFLPQKNIAEFPHATDIRNKYFTHDASYKRSLPESTIEFLESFKTTDKFKRLKEEFDFLTEYKAKWDGAPFQPIFHTVDCVVIKSGHVLLVKRKGKLGKGLLALPGGFLNPNETIKTAALRELREETVIKVSKEELESCIIDQKVFDKIDRSTRGRTVTTAFLINLKHGSLPRIKGSDDAECAFWVPLNEVYSRDMEFFEDHWHIINYFCNRF